MSVGNDSTTAILLKGQEDFAGLWEIPAVISHSTEDRLSLAVTIVRDLLTKGLVQLVWGNPNPQEDKPLSLAEAEEALRNASWWSGDQPFAGRQVWLYTTPAGERWLDRSGG